MIIENPDAFKSWLTSILEPLCDADPAALAKYVYALVKKDKPLEELREGMVDQLDVFLQQETKPFVDMLFKSLESNEYLKANIERQPSPSPQPAENDKQLDGEEQPVPAITATAPGAKSPGASAPVTAAPAVAAEAPRQRLVLPRGRPPQHEHTLVKVLPLTELLEETADQVPRRRDRRGDSLRDREDRRRRRSRSLERRGRARRYPRDADHLPHPPHPSHPAHPAHPPHSDARRYEKRRPLSRSPSPRGRYRNRSPPPAVLERQSSRSRSRSPIPVRDRDHDRERERLRIPREQERDRISRDREHRDRISRSRDRERSRDRSRDRSRGSTSPRLEVPDAFKRRCRDYDEKGYCMRGDFCEWDHGTDPLVLEDATLSRVLPMPPPVPEYNPLTPDIWCGSGFGAFGAPHHAHPPLGPHAHAPPHAPHAPHAHAPPRELVPIPRVRHDARTEPRSEIVPPPRHAPPSKKNLDYHHRLGARPPLPANAANCSLEVKKVPRGLNDITHLNNHFSKFGKIVNIQVNFEGDPEAALITFSNPTEANVAYKSTEAVLNNRFIKVFWHNPENKQENMAPGGQQINKQSDRQNSQHPMSHNKVLINRDNIKATADNKQQAEKVKTEKAKEVANGQEPKEKPLKPIDKNKQIIDVQKRCQALLQTQLQQQRLLIQRLESGNVTGAQRTALMEAINSAQEATEKLRKELNCTMKQLQEESVARSMSRLQLAQVRKPKTREEAQKEILDAELDMFTKQQEGQDVTDLIKKIADLRRQMAIQFPSHPIIRRGHSRGGRFGGTRYVRGGGAGVGGKGFSVNQSVDHRPRALLVSGFEPDELDALLAHFAQFGEVTGKEANLAVPELVLQYRARAQAELAAQRAKHYNDRTLSITWVTNAKPLNPAPPAPVHNGDATQEEPKENEKRLSEEALLRFDEEEEEAEEEDRSWRR